MTFRLFSTRSRQWLVIHWLLFLLWAFAGFIVTVSFIISFVGMDPGAERDLPLQLLLAAIVLPLALFFGRRFALDALRWHKRNVKLDDGKLRLRDSVWLSCPHAIPYEVISSISIPRRDQRGKAAYKNAILDLSTRAPLSNQVYVAFNRPLAFERRQGPILFDLVLAFMEPIGGESVKGIILEVGRRQDFLRACKELGLPVTTH